MQRLNYHEDNMLKLLCALFLISALNSANAQPNLMVGISSEDITPPVGTPLGGYGGTDRRLKLFLD